MAEPEEDYFTRWKRKNPRYFIENTEKNRIIDKEFGRRFRDGESMPGETYTQFKKRLKSEEKDKLNTSF